MPQSIHQGSPWVYSHHCRTAHDTRTIRLQLLGGAHSQVMTAASTYVRAKGHESSCACDPSGSEFPGLSSPREPWVQACPMRLLAAVQRRQQSAVCALG